MIKELDSFNSPADALVYIESVLADKAGDFARALYVKVATGEIDSDQAEAAIEFMLDEFKREVREQLRPRIEAIYRKL